MSDAFISYSHLDREFAARLQRALKDSGKAIWVDEADIPSGARWAEDLKGAIEGADTFVFIVSPDSVYQAVASLRRLLTYRFRSRPFSSYRRGVSSKMNRTPSPTVRLLARFNSSSAPLTPI